MTELNDAMVEAAAKILCCGSVCNASGRPGDQCTASKFFGEKARLALTAAIALLPEAEQGWQSMGTAPKDGTKIDLLYPEPRGRAINCFWKGELGFEWVWKEPKWDGGILLPESEWFTHCYPNMQPTHWRPLPAPPPAEGGQKA